MGGCKGKVDSIFIGDFLGNDERRSDRRNGLFFFFFTKQNLGSFFNVTEGAAGIAMT